MTEKRKEKVKAKDAKLKVEKSEELHQQISELQKEKDELFGKLQRVSADYVNFEKRAPKQIADSISYEKERIIKSLLPVIDNFEHTLANVHTAEDSEAFVKGIRIIYDQMQDILKSHGVEQISALGEKFEPAFHEAMMQRSEPEKEDNTVLEEFQKGYKLNGRVIRPSKVIVNKSTAEKESIEEKQGEEQPPKTDEPKITDTQ